MANQRNQRDDLAALRQLRDEARVQAHLFNAELRSQWEKLESDWKSLKRNLRQDQPEMMKPINDIKSASAPLIEDLHAAYTRLLHGVKRDQQH